MSTPVEGNQDPKVVSTTVESVVPEVTSEPEAKPSESKTFDENYVKGLREEAAKHRTEKQAERKAREDLEARIKEYEDAKLSADEKLQRDFEETKATLQKYQTVAQEKELALQLALAAKDENISDLKAAIKLADRELIQYDDNGQISNMTDVIADLKGTYSSLFSSGNNTPTASPGVTNPPKAPASRKYTREDLKKMPPERVKQLHESGELAHILAGGR